MLRTIFIPLLVDESSFFAHFMCFEVPALAPPPGGPANGNKNGSNGDTNDDDDLGIMDIDDDTSKPEMVFTKEERLKANWEGFTMLKEVCHKDAELIQKILVRLPVKSLLRFKSVCKSWHSLIESSFFIDLHTDTTFSSSSSDDKFGSFIVLATVERYFVAQPFKRAWEYALLMLSSESVSKSVSVPASGGSGSWWLSTDSDCKPPSWAVLEDKDQPDYDDRVFKVDNYYSNDEDQQQQLVFKLDSLGFPACYKFYEKLSLAEIVGSCHGILCLYDRRDHQDVSLFNPATRQFRVLPKSITTDGHTLLAFGFDVKTKDYKVLLLTCLNLRHYRQVAPAECPCRVQVYSLSTNSWRFLEGITCLPGFPIDSAIDGHVLYLNGSCFFMAKFLYTRTQRCFPENNRFIIKFDFTEEIFTPMQLPDHHQKQELYLSSLGDKVAIFTVACYVKDDDNKDIWITDQEYKFDTGICSQVFNIWVLDEREEIWKEFHSFRIDRKKPGEWILPRGLSDDGEFAMLETTYSTGLAKKMLLYNLVTKEVKKNFLSCSRLMSKANAYKPSLVSCSLESAAAAAAAADRVIGDRCSVVGRVQGLSGGGIGGPLRVKRRRHEG